MISSLRNFAKTKFAGLLVFIMIIPFVFWGMGGMFSSGNTNNIAKINNNSISTEDFIDYVNKSGIPEKTIRENLEQNIIEEILSGLVSTTTCAQCGATKMPHRACPSCGYYRGRPVVSSS